MFMNESFSILWFLTSLENFVANLRDILLDFVASEIVASLEIKKWNHL